MKCAIQDGVYTYQPKKNGSKTVPRIRWEYEYSPKGEEDSMKKFYEANPKYISDNKIYWFSTQYLKDKNDKAFFQLKWTGL